MKKPFGKTKVGIILKSVLKGTLDVAVDVLPAGESIKTIIKTVTSNGNTPEESPSNVTEIYKIVRAVIIGGLIFAFVTGRIDLESFTSISESLSE